MTAAQMARLSVLAREVRGQMRQSKLLEIIGQMREIALSERFTRASFDSKKRKPVAASSSTLQTR